MRSGCTAFKRLCGGRCRVSSASRGVWTSSPHAGSSASVSLVKLYLTWYLKDELVCMDLAADAIVWRRHYSDGYADSQAITPDGKTLYLPLRDGDSWWVIDAASSDVKAKIPVAH